MFILDETNSLTAFYIQFVIFFMSKGEYDNQKVCVLIVTYE